ncbi:MAG TPA: bifunctional phosphoribosylaminoimidazolecarboxamide formyltransferase/IMP cyclohydrolase [Vicinamibacterales bacterium]|jgi:phosphoribosylaminoimidazolecarboxamide formyltransferase/IMP cyclohydrolase|nr:bifunctional phosphoribosylaminoimidazolecarboxamide formyltransferase/IMP cyclohydrolase [Vicinamibacterales bacterium]
MRAILSVSDKSGLVDFARGLSNRGVDLVSTGGTARALADAGLPVTNVSDVTGFPEMMDGRVKTLHPKIHGGILARRHRPDDLAAIAAQSITPVDLVVVNLYPFAKAAADPNTPFDHLVEQIDIGGPSLLRAAGKNFQDVMVVVDPADYARVLQALESPSGPSLAFKFELMKKAFAHTAEFDTLISQTLNTITCSGSEFTRGSVPAPVRDGTTDAVPLRYGENPHQQAWWGPLPADAGAWQVHQGKGLSYTNLLDLDAALRIALEFSEPVGVVIKHTNPCGVATGETLAGAYVAARDADPLSAFGGIVGLNRPIDAETAKAITATFIEAVIAPSIADDAREILAKKVNMRVVTTDFDTLRHGGGQEMRSFLGGTLTQDRDRVAEAQQSWPSPAAAGSSPDSQIRVVTQRQPTAEEWTALRFAWRVCAHVKSNTIVFTTATRTAAVGAGQMSRVDAVKVAVMKAGDGALTGTVAASDAFFPFRDGLDAIADAGATAVVQPGGSVRDAEVIAAADERGLAMIFTGRRHFRH